MDVFGNYAKYYNLLYNDKDYAEEADYIENLIKKHHPAAKTVLDLGCGTGRHDFQLSGKGFSVVGVDRSDEMLTTARKYQTTTGLNRNSARRCGLNRRNIT